VPDFELSEAEPSNFSLTLPWTLSGISYFRRELNSRVVDSQSTALIHLATSTPTPTQVLVSIYDHIHSDPLPRYQREAFSYTITRVYISCFLELGEEKLQTKRLDCSLHCPFTDQGHK
ncbi:hypothetical protein S83_008191, partial [Arachis hypogaea]